MPNTNTTATNPYHLPLLLCLFVLCFFPSLIGPILYSPLSLLSYSISLLPWSHPTSTSVYSSQGTATMSWTQKQFTLPAKARGSYLITDTVYEKVPEIKEYKVGILQLFVQHTSCALSLNENYDEDVRYVSPLLPYTPPPSSLLPANMKLAATTCPTPSTASPPKTAKETSTAIQMKVSTICLPTSNPHSSVRVSVCPSPMEN
jgi:hypothetical protein